MDNWDAESLASILALCHGFNYPWAYRLHRHFQEETRGKTISWVEGTPRIGTRLVVIT